MPQEGQISSGGGGALPRQESTIESPPSGVNLQMVLQKQIRRRLVAPVSRYRGQPSRRRHSRATAACLGRGASMSPGRTLSISTPPSPHPRSRPSPGAGRGDEPPPHLESSNRAVAANVAARPRHGGELGVAQRPKQESRRNTWNGRGMAGEVAQA